MLSKRSENLLKSDAITARPKAGITSSLRANLAVPFVLLAIYGLANFLKATTVLIGTSFG